MLSVRAAAFPHDRRALRHTRNRELVVGIENSHEHKSSEHLDCSGTTNAIQMPQLRSRCSLSATVVRNYVGGDDGTRTRSLCRDRNAVTGN